MMDSSWDSIGCDWSAVDSEGQSGGLLTARKKRDIAMSTMDLV